ncbi:cytochrome P450 [Streptomyces diastatochromogenes]|uniref:cytochrome P450 n=1 Tax=Streptomyces diastatochromogenes TaxID=42236 RepID=UPI00368360CB
MTVSATAPTAPVPTAPGRLPLLGHAVPLLRNPVQLLQSIRPLGDIVRIRIGPLDVYVLNSPDLVHQVFASEATTYRKGRFYEKFRPYQGDGLFTTDGDEHQRQRRLVLPAFHRERLTTYTDVMRQVAADHCADWTPGAALDICAEMYALTSEVVAKVLFGGELDREQVAGIQAWLPVFIQGMGRRVVSPAAWLDRLPTPGNRRFDTAQRRLRGLVDDLVEAHRRDTADRGDLLSMLVAARDPDTGEPMSPARLRDEAMTFLTAGIETVSTTLTWLYHELATHPEVEERLTTELDEVLGGRPVTFDELADLPYTRSVVRETLRLHSPAWMLMRRPAGPTTLGGVALPAGAELLFSPATLHRDPALHPRPLEFRPERWLDGDTAPPPFLPFSTGPYKCLGDHFALTELATTVATITARWRLVPVSSRAPREVAGAALSPDRLVLTARRRDA